MYDERRVHDAALALMHLNAHADMFGWRAWKTFPWEATEDGARLAEQLFTEVFEVHDAETEGPR